MKYGIKLRDRLQDGGVFLRNRAMATISEHQGPNSENVITFESIADAEVYAQDHELSNYEIDVVKEKGSR